MTNSGSNNLAENQRAAVGNEPDFSGLTVILPTLNEAGSIGELLVELIRLAPGAGLIVADDGSADGTQLKVRDIAEQYPGTKISLLERSNARVRGITASVIDAVKICRTPYFLVMDADLQHPPEAAAGMFAELVSGADVVVSCRIGTEENYPLYRRAISAAASFLAHRGLALRGVSVSDPLSGFFAARTEDFLSTVESAGNRFQSSGYKVLFDYLKVAAGNTQTSVGSHPLVIREVFYEFGRRRAGKSKLGFRQVLSFLKSLVS